MLPNRIRVLWIEDEARYQLNELMGPLLYRRIYHLSLAENATEAMRLIRTTEHYDVIIVDMRIPPGEDPAWKMLYQDQGNDTSKARLGQYLIEWMLGQMNGHAEQFSVRPNWIQPQQIAVFSAEEPSGMDRIFKMGVKVYQPKDASYPDDILVQLVGRVMNCKEEQDKRGT